MKAHSYRSTIIWWIITALLAFAIGIAGAIATNATELVFHGKDGSQTKIVAGLNKLPTLIGDVRADATPANTQSVLFKLNGNARPPENVPPYYCHGDKNGVPNWQTWTERGYTISAACYTKDNAKGTTITAGGVSTQFTLQLSGVTPPDDPDPPVPPVGSPRFPRGYAIYPQGNHQWVPGPSLSADLLAHQPIEWILYRERWKHLEGTKDVYTLDLMRRELQRYVAAGKKVGVLVMTGGGCSPDWLTGPRHQGVLVPWAPFIGPEFRQLTERISKIELTPGVPLANDPRLVLYYPNGPTVPSHEMHLQGMEAAPGFSAEVMYQAWAYAIETQDMYFPNVAGGIAISVKTPVLPYLDRVIVKLQQAKGRELALFQHNALSNQDGCRLRTYKAHQKLFDLHAQGWKVGCEALDSAQDNPTRMETNDFMVAVRNLPVGVYFVGYPPDWRHYKQKMP